MNTQQYQDGNYYQANVFARNVLATAGIMNFCEEHKCYWLLDVIVSHLPTAVKKQADYMLVAELKLGKNDSCVFTLSDEFNGEPRIIAKQNIEFTDLDQDTVFWVINDDPSVPFSLKNRSIILLPSEY